MKKINLINIGIISLGLSAGALAATKHSTPSMSNNAIYLGVNAGVETTSQTRMNENLDLGAQLGYRMGNWRIEEAYNFYNSTRFHTLMTNGYYDFSNCSKFIPYVGFGIGWAHRYNGSWLGNKQSRNTFGYQGIFGIDYKVSHNKTIGINYRYLDAFQDTNAVNASFNYYFN